MFGVNALISTYLQQSRSLTIQDSVLVFSRACVTRWLILVLRGVADVPCVVVIIKVWPQTIIGFLKGCSYIVSLDVDNSSGRILGSVIANFGVIHAVKVILVLHSCGVCSCGFSFLTKYVQSALYKFLFCFHPAREFAQACSIALLLPPFPTKQ